MTKMTTKMMTTILMVLLFTGCSPQEVIIPQHVITPPIDFWPDQHQPKGFNGPSAPIDLINDLETTI